MWRNGCDYSPSFEFGSYAGQPGTGHGVLRRNSDQSEFISYRVSHVSGVNERLNIKNTDPLYGGFVGEFVRNSAQMEWSAAVGDYTLVSDPIVTSSSSFAEIGHERNGSFF